MKRRQDSLTHSLDTLPPGSDDHPTDPSQLAPDTPRPEGFEVFGKLVRDTMRHELQMQLEPVQREQRLLKSSVTSLTNAFNEHTSDEAKRSAAMLKVLAIRGALPTLAFVMAAVALTVSLMSTSASADGPNCSPHAVDAGYE